MRGALALLLAIAALSALSALCVAPLAQEKSNATTCALQGAEDRLVIRVVDGETFIVDGGSEVRLMGALAPRPFDSAGGATEWPLAAQARSALEHLVVGRSVRLSFAGRRTDRYGRLLAHVFVGEESSRIWVQGQMLQRGLARAYALDGHTECLAELIENEARARESATGLWAETIYAVRSADDVAALLRLTGTFQVVEGTVVAVSNVRGATYVNFGEDWRQDFTAMMRAPGKRAGREPDPALAALQGRKARVRGWIERRGGPMIEIHHAAAIEVLAQEVQPADTGTRSRRRTRRQ